ncbi:unnamed protein product, partial [Heterotrigona itama]
RGTVPENSESLPVSELSTRNEWFLPLFTGFIFAYLSFFLFGRHSLPPAILTFYFIPVGGFPPLKICVTPNFPSDRCPNFDKFQLKLVLTLDFITNTPRICYVDIIRCGANINLYNKP